MSLTDEILKLPTYRKFNFNTLELLVSRKAVLGIVAGARLTPETIIKADRRTGSSHMTNREEWGELMAEQLGVPLASLEAFADKLEAAIKARDFRDDWGPFDVQQSCSEMVHEQLHEQLHEFLLGAAAMTPSRYGKQGR